MDGHEAGPTVEGLRPRLAATEVGLPDNAIRPAERHRATDRARWISFVSHQRSLRPEAPKWRTGRAPGTGLISSGMPATSKAEWPLTAMTLRLSADWPIIAPV